MRSREIASVAAGLMFLAAGPEPGPACTVVQHQRGPEMVVGRTFDWAVGHGTLRSNPRGMLRRGVSARWVSRYGSVTIDQFGAGMPLGGMNEAGLVVEETSYWPSRPPSLPDRPAVNEFEWIQLQLDLRATVDEVVEGLGEFAIAPTGFGQHYLVADAAGDVAVVEFLEGDVVVWRGDALAPPVITNDTYERSVRALGEYEGFGGDRQISRSALSPDRFARAARGLRQFDPGVPPATGLERLLADLAGPDTRWRVIHDLSRRTVRVSVDGEPWWSVDIGDVDLRCGAPVQTFGLGTRKGGGRSLRLAWEEAGEDPAALDRLEPEIARATSAVPHCGGPVTVTLVANAGVRIEAPGQRVFVDAFFDLLEPPSDKPPRRHAHLAREPLARLEGGLAPWGEADLLLATHDHDDHLTRDSVQRALAAQPRAGFVAPGVAVGVDRSLPEYPEPGSVVRFRHRGCEAVAIGVPHGRREAAEFGHVAWLVHAAGRRILHLGDASADPEDLARVFGRAGRVDAVVLPVSLLDRAGSRHALQAGLGDTLVLAVHVDPYQRKAARAAAADSGLARCVLLEHPLQSVVIGGS